MHYTKTLRLKRKKKKTYNLKSTNHIALTVLSEQNRKRNNKKKKKNKREVADDEIEEDRDARKVYNKTIKLSVFSWIMYPRFPKNAKESREKKKKKN